MYAIISADSLGGSTIFGIVRCDVLSAAFNAVVVMVGDKLGGMVFRIGGAILPTHSSLINGRFL